MKYNKLTDDQKKFILKERYNHTAYEIGAIINASGSTVTKFLAAKGLRTQKLKKQSVKYLQGV